MSEIRATDLGETPAIEVRVYRDGALIHRQLCESTEDAAAVVDQWEQGEGVECDVDDLSAQHRPGDVLEPELAEPIIDDYPVDDATRRGS